TILIASSARSVGENAERLQVASGSGWFHGVAIAIHCRIVLSGVLIFDTWKIPVNTLPCERSQYRSDEVLAYHVTLLVQEREEKRLVLDDRAAKAPAELIPVFIIFLGPVEVIKPTAGIERRIPIRKEWAAAKLIRSGSCRHLHLPRTAPRFGIDRRGNDANLFDEIGTG